MKFFQLTFALLLFKFYANAQITKEQAIDSLFNAKGVFDVYKKFTPEFINEFVNRIPADSMKSSGRRDIEKMVNLLKEEMLVESKRNFQNKFSEREMLQITELVNSGILMKGDEVAKRYKSGRISKEDFSSLVKSLSSDLYKNVNTTLRSIKEEGEDKFIQKLIKNIEPLSKKYDVK